MCDFLIQCTAEYRGADLLDLIKKPYGEKAPEGFAFDFPWGSLAVLEDRYGQCNVRIEANVVIAWIGDIVSTMTDRRVAELIKSTGILRSTCSDGFATAPVFSQLNGAFTIIVADTNGFSVITDLRSFSTVYMGKRCNELVSIGSHCDSVAAVSNTLMAINEVNAAQFLAFGAVCFPDTLYLNVSRLEPATILSCRFTSENHQKVSRSAYWKVPDELTSWDQDDLTEELGELLRQAVRRRCTGDNLAVTLSGGLDSRMILACVPRGLDCTAITFYDSFNRETKIARRIAASCGRAWMPLCRHDEYVGDNLLQTVRFIGCEGLFVYAHMLGFADRLGEENFSSILSGTQMDVYCKGYYAYDLKVQKRWHNGKVPRIQKTGFDFLQTPASLWQNVFTSELLSMLSDSRRTFARKYADGARTSQYEWLMLNPVDMMFVSWRAERRVSPVRLIALDRDILEFCFKCPAVLKAGKYIFLRAAAGLMGAAALIPTADRGEVPAAGRLSNLTRRMLRKFDDFATTLTRPRVQHSWHDYQTYWQQSAVLKELARQYVPNLECFEGTLFRRPASEFLTNADIDWHHAFRLLQFAVWIDTVQKNRIMFSSSGNGSIQGQVFNRKAVNGWKKAVAKC